MDVQLILVILLFIAALAYVVRMIYRAVNAKQSCGSNCKCGVNFDNIPSPKK